MAKHKVNIFRYGKCLLDRMKNNIYNLPENLRQERLRLLRYIYLVIMILFVLIVFFGPTLLAPLFLLITVSLVSVMHHSSTDRGYRSAINKWIEENVHCPKCSGKVKILQWFFPWARLAPCCKVKCSKCGDTSTFSVGYSDVAQVDLGGVEIPKYPSLLQIILLIIIVLVMAIALGFYAHLIR